MPYAAIERIRKGDRTIPSSGWGRMADAAERVEQNQLPNGSPLLPTYSPMRIVRAISPDFKVFKGDSLQVVVYNRTGGGTLDPIPNALEYVDGRVIHECTPAGSWTPTGTTNVAFLAPRWLDGVALETFEQGTIGRIAIAGIVATTIRTDGRTPLVYHRSLPGEDWMTAGHECRSFERHVFGRSKYRGLMPSIGFGAELGAIPANSESFSRAWAMIELNVRNPISFVETIILEARLEEGGEATGHAQSTPQLKFRVQDLTPLLSAGQPLESGDPCAVAIYERFNNVECRLINAKVDCPPASGGGSTNTVGPVAAIGAINGANATFSTPSDYVPGTLKVYANGILLTAGEYTEAPPRGFSLANSPLAGESITTAYETVANKSRGPLTPTGAIDGVNTVFTTPANYVAGTLQVFLNGLQAVAGEFTETSANGFSLATAPGAGETVTVIYQEV